MILGVGIDIVEVPRVQRVYARFGRRFLNRILLGTEIDYCLGMAMPAPAVAGRFAAKEAIAKALCTRIGPGLGWQDMEISRDKSGTPAVVLHGKGRTLADARGIKKIHVSLSHTQRYAVAIAVAEG